MYTRANENKSLKGLAILGVIIALGWALRAYRLGEESVWWDEYTSLMHLNAPDILTFLHLNRMFDPLTLPLYYALEYLSWHHLSPSVIALRWVSVVLGVAAIPVLYAIGKRLQDRIAGLVAAWCLALSPIHIFHAQGIRMYVLLNLLALLSMYFFIRVLQDEKKRWWGGDAASNFLLLWTHPFAVLLLAAQGIFGVFYWRRPRPILCWGAIHVLLAFPTAAYLLSVRFWPEETTGNWLRVPSVAEFLADVFADDAVGLTYQLRISERVWPWLTSFRSIMDGTSFFLAVLSLGVMFWLAMMRPSPRLINEGKSISFSWRAKAGLVSCWLLLPPLTLYAASWIWRPCIFPRYTLYCVFALYLMFGMAVSWLPRRSFKILAVTILTGVMGYQAALTIPGPQRTDWKKTSEYLREQASPDDVILVHVAIWRDVFLFNMGQVANPVSSAETREVLAEQTRFLCDTFSSPRKVWVVIPTAYFDQGPDRAFERCAEAYGLSATMKEFSGIEHVLVYRMERSQDPGTPQEHTSKADPESYAYLEAYGNLAVALAERGEYPLAMAALRKTFKSDGSCDPVYANLVKAIECNNGIAPALAAVKALRMGYRVHSSFAVAQFKAAVAQDPSYAIAYTELGVALARQKSYAEAAAALRRGIELNPEYALRYARLAQVMEEGGNVENTLQSVDLVLKGIMTLAGQPEEVHAILKQAQALDPLYGAVHVVLSMVCMSQNDMSGFLKEIREAMNVEPSVYGPWKPFIEALFERQNPQDAWAEYQKLQSAGVYLPPEFVSLMQQQLEQEKKSPKAPAGSGAALPEGFTAST